MTKQIIKEAVITLLRRGNETMINVRSICEVAQINRSTFYTHYQDKQMLLREMVLDTMQKAHDFAKAYLNRNNTTESLLEMLQYYYNNSSFFLTLLKTDYSNTFIKTMTESIWKIHKEFCESKKEHFNTEDEYTISYKVAGCICMIEKWLKKDIPEPTLIFANYLLDSISGRNLQ